MVLREIVFDGVGVWAAAPAHNASETLRNRARVRFFNEVRSLGETAFIRDT